MKSNNTKNICTLTIAFIILAISIGNVAGQAGEPISPDLTVTEITAPISSSPGSSFIVGWTVKNVGSMGGTSYGNIICLSGNIDTCDNHLGTTGDLVVLESGESYSQSTSVTIPSNIALGDYYIIVKTFVHYDHNSDNDILAKAITINNGITTDPVALPDLTVTEITVPTISSPGMSFNVGWTGKNIGEANAIGEFGNWYDFVYISEDTNIDNSDTFLEDGTMTNPLAPGDSYSQSKSVTIPSNIVTGDYYILVKTDFFGGVTESNENNNILVKAITIGPTAPVPEVPTIIMVSLGIFGLLYIGRRKK